MLGSGNCNLISSISICSDSSSEDAPDASWPEGSGDGSGVSAALRTLRRRATLCLVRCRFNGCNGVEFAMMEERGGKSGKNVTLNGLLWMRCVGSCILLLDRSFCAPGYSQLFFCLVVRREFRKGRVASAQVCQRRLEVSYRTKVVDWFVVGFCECERD